MSKCRGKGQNPQLGSKFCGCRKLWALVITQVTASKQWNNYHQHSMDECSFNMLKITKFS